MKIGFAVFEKSQRTKERTNEQTNQPTNSSDDHTLHADVIDAVCVCVKKLLRTSGHHGQSGLNVQLAVVTDSRLELGLVLLLDVQAMTSNGPLVIPCHVQVPLSLCLCI